MRAHEFINEGPGYFARRKQEKQIKRLTKDTNLSWQRQLQNLKASGINIEDTGALQQPFQTWAERHFKGTNVTGAEAIDLADPNAMNAFLRQKVGNWLGAINDPKTKVKHPKSMPSTATEPESVFEPKQQEPLPTTPTPEVPQQQQTEPAKKPKAKKPALSQSAKDVIGGLSNIGFTKTQAKAAVQKVLATDDVKDEGDLMGKALRLLNSGLKAE